MGQGQHTIDDWRKRLGPYKPRWDCKGVPIHPGDLLRTPHFQDRRRRQWFLYHTVVAVGEVMEMVPTSELEPSKANGSGRCWLSEEMAAAAEVIDGHGPGDCLGFTDRPKRTARATAPTP